MGFTRLARWHIESGPRAQLQNICLQDTYNIVILGSENIDAWFNTKL